MPVPISGTDCPPGWFADLYRTVDAMRAEVLRLRAAVASPERPQDRQHAFVTMQTATTGSVYRTSEAAAIGTGLTIKTLGRPLVAGETYPCQFLDWSTGRFWTVAPPDPTAVIADGPPQDGDVVTGDDTDTDGTGDGLRWAGICSVLRHISGWDQDERQYLMHDGNGDCYWLTAGDCDEEET